MLARMKPSRLIIAGLALSTLACGGAGSSSGRTIPAGSPAFACGSCKIFGVDVDGGVAFLADYSGNLIVLDVSDPASPKEISRLAVKYPTAVKTVGNTVYVTGGELSVVDVTDLAHPAMVTTVDTWGSDAYAVTDSAGLLYEGGSIYDITAPNAPVHKVNLPITTSSYGAFVDGHTLYLSCANEGFKIIDITDPSAPKLVSSTPTNYASGIVAIGTHAYVTEQNEKKMLVFDVSNPATPSQVGEVDLGDGGSGIAVSGANVVVAAGQSGLIEFDVSDPKAPKKIKDAGTGHDTHGVKVDGGLAWGADQGKGIFNLAL